MIATFVGIIGAFLILIVFLLNQFDKLKNDNFYYDFLNFLGSVFLVYFAYMTSSWPFFILNSVWGLVSLKDCISYFKRKKSIFFLDLDNTLFDTMGLAEYNHVLMKKDFPEITKEQQQKAEEMVFPKNAGLYDYSINADTLSEITGIDNKKIKSWFEFFYSNEPSDRFLFSDVFGFIEFAKTKGKVVVLSFGVDKVQIPRIINSKLSLIVDDYIVTQGNKGEHIQKYLDENKIKNNEIIFIDDSLKHLNNVKNINPNTKTFHILRRFKEGDKVEKEHILVKNLNEVIKYLC
jgi:FMN phosphatase YigB (HAD superfamily)